MIARLKGIVAEIAEEEMVLDVAGVGYLVRCGARTLTRAPAVGEEALLHIESVWSEAQGPRLYGFMSREERRAFTLLTAIQGVGPKAALAVLDIASPGELADAAARGDKALVSRAQGVGPKLAQRIVSELKDKPLGGGGGLAVAPASAPRPAAGEAVAALMSLGVAEATARRAVEQALERLDDGAGEAALIKAALQEIGR